MFTLSRITTLNFITLLVIYIGSINTLQFFGLMPEEAPGAFAVWYVAWLVIFIFLYIFRYKYDYFTAKYTWLVSVALVSVLFTVMSAIASNEMSIYTFSTILLLPPIFLFVFFILAGRYQLSPSRLMAFNKLYIFYVFAAIAYNLVANYDSLALLIGGVYTHETLYTSSVFTDRNTYGLVMAFAVIASFIQTRLANKRSKKLAYSFICIISLMATLSSMSRGALLFCTVFIITYYVLKKGIRGLISSLAVLITIFSMVVGLIGFDTVNQLLVRGEDGSSGRDEVISFGIDQVSSENIMFGVGPSRGEALVDKKLDVKSYHNTYLSLLINGGIGALFVFTSIILVSFTKIRKIHKSNPILAAAFASMLVAYLLYGAIESSLLFILSPTSIIVSLYVIVFPLYVSNYYMQPKRVIQI